LRGLLSRSGPVAAESHRPSARRRRRAQGLHRLSGMAVVVCAGVPSGALPRGAEFAEHGCQLCRGSDAQRRGGEDAGARNLSCPAHGRYSRCCEGGESAGAARCDAAPGFRLTPLVPPGLNRPYGGQGLSRFRPYRVRRGSAGSQGTSERSR
jgi:hypothetical protein